MKATGEQKFPVGTVYYIQYKAFLAFQSNFWPFLNKPDLGRVVKHYGKSRENIPIYTLISYFVSPLGKRGIFHFSNPTNWTFHPFLMSQKEISWGACRQHAPFASYIYTLHLPNDLSLRKLFLEEFPFWSFGSSRFNGWNLSKFWLNDLIRIHLGNDQFLVRAHIVPNLLQEVLANISRKK